MRETPAPMDRSFNWWVQLVTATAVLALAAALIVVGFTYYGRGDPSTPAQRTEVR